MTIRKSKKQSVAVLNAVNEQTEQLTLLWAEDIFSSFWFRLPYASIQANGAGELQFEKFFRNRYELPIW